MTTILMQRTKDPETCMACGRLAIGLGVHEPKKAVQAWVCSADCYPATRTLTTMKANELIAIEKTACNVAARAVSETVLNEVMGAMWDAGVRDLSAATPEQVTQAIGTLNSGAIAGQVEAALVAFGASVKQQLADGACPF
ncbi:MAG: hypothetical protein K2X84_07410 [Beijerinckiaceae bacterium]|nr:hypothetical protein [Beijerinckiaceae bacterium]